MPLKLHSMNSCPNWNNMYGMFRKATLAYDDGVWDIAVTMWEAYMLEEKMRKPGVTEIVICGTWNYE